MVRNGPAQFRCALIGQGLQKGGAHVQHHLPLQPAPHGKGEIPRCAAGQIKGQSLRRFGRHSFRLSGPGAAQFRLLHEKSPLGIGADVALLAQVIVSRFYGNFADLQIGCQRPLGRQFRPGGQATLGNVLPDGPVQSFV